MKRYNVKDAREEIKDIEKMVAEGWKGTAYAARTEGNIFEVSLTKGINGGGLAGQSYMSCEWTPLALKTLSTAKGVKLKII
jgi:hypothetical protein